jgi:hypothetical protein
MFVLQSKGAGESRWFLADAEWRQAIMGGRNGCSPNLKNVFHGCGGSLYALHFF